MLKSDWRALAAGMAMCVILAAAGSAQNFAVLYHFKHAPDGETPFGIPLVTGGKVYGTTHSGGAHNLGTIYAVDISSGQETVLYSFPGGAGGAYPQAGLVGDAAGNLYGTSQGVSGYGTVFAFSASGGMSILHNFTGPDGLAPYGRLVRDEDGNLYGTTSAGGASGHGTVFKLDAAGNLTTLRNFEGGYDGGAPFDGLFAQDGRLYGTSNGAYVPGGAPYFGTVFVIDDPETGQSNTLYHFGAQGPGTLPVGGVVADGTGNVYGTTLHTGALFGGSGVIFKLYVPQNEYTVLHTFAGGPGDGTGPTGGLISAPGGFNYYGTTVAGGTYGAGTVYKMDMQIGSGTDTATRVTILHNFAGSDGEGPWAGLTQDSRGILYGVTEEGGQYGAGVVFAVQP